MFSETVINLVDAIGVKVVDWDDLNKVTGSGVPEGLFQPTAIYDFMFDIVSVNPRSSYNKDELLLHEIIHWSGHPIRLNRYAIASSVLSNSINVLSIQEIINEEVIAEIGMYHLITFLGLNVDAAKISLDSYLKKFKSNDVEYCEAEAIRAASWVFGQLVNKKVA